MNAKTFGLMKNGGYFINTARGALVDENALYDALASGKLTAAAIDVYEVEPVSADDPLFKLPNNWAQVQSRGGFPGLLLWIWAINGKAPPPKLPDSAAGGREPGEPVSGPS
jgi:hypothetical protein